MFGRRKTCFFDDSHKFERLSHIHSARRHMDCSNHCMCLGIVTIFLLLIGVNCFLYDAQKTHLRGLWTSKGSQHSYLFLYFSSQSNTEIIRLPSLQTPSLSTNTTAQIPPKPHRCHYCWYLNLALGVVVHHLMFVRIRFTTGQVIQFTAPFRYIHTLHHIMSNQVSTTCSQTIS